MKEIAGNGWVKLYREIEKHWVYDDAEKLKTWITLLIKASHQKIKINIGYELVELEPGQLVFGLNKYSKLIDIDRNKLYRIIKLLEQDQMIEYDTQTYNNFSIITILNWDKYQSETPSSSAYQQKQADNETQMKHKRNTSETQVKTNNNVKNEKNDKNNIYVIWDYYCEKFKGVYEPEKFTKTRESKIRARLKTYSIEQLKKAIDNLRQSEWHCGANEQGRVYAKPEFLFRNDEKVEEWLQYKPKGRKEKKESKTSKDPDEIAKEYYKKGYR